MTIDQIIRYYFLELYLLRFLRKYGYLYTGYWFSRIQ